MTPIEIMAAFVALLILVKLVTVGFKPKAWMDNVAKPIYSNASIATVVGLVIAGGSLWFLLKELSIVQIFAAMLFFIGLMVVGIAPLGKDLMVMADKMVKQKNLLKQFWLAWVIWVVLAVWVLYTLFA